MNPFFSHLLKAVQVWNKKQCSYKTSFRTVSWIQNVPVSNMKDWNLFVRDGTLEVVRKNVYALSKIWCEMHVTSFSIDFKTAALTTYFAERCRSCMPINTNGTTSHFLDKVWLEPVAAWFSGACVCLSSGYLNYLSGCVFVYLQAVYLSIRILNQSIYQTAFPLMCMAVRVPVWLAVNAFCQFFMSMPDLTVIWLPICLTGHMPLCL